MNLKSLKKPWKQVKRSPISLRIFGVGRTTISRTNKILGINNRPKATKVHLNLRKFKQITRFAKRKILGKELQKLQKEIYLFPQTMKSYKGTRNKLKYPSRGQRTHTNARTKRRIKA